MPVLAAAAAAVMLLAACSTTATGAAQEEPVTLKVGLLYTTSGRGGELASTVLGAAGMAVTEAAERGVTIELVEADYAGDESLIESEAARLAGEADAIVVGSGDSAVAAGLDAIVEKPVLHAFNGNDDLLEGKDNVFRLAPSNMLSATTIAEFLAEERGYKRIAVATDTTDFGREGAADLAVAFARARVTPVLSRSFDPGAEIHTLVTQAGQRNAQALVVWTDSPSEAARIVVEAHKMNESYQIVLSGNLATATFAKSATAQVTPVAFRDGMLSVGTWAGPWFPLARFVRFYSDFQTQNSALAPVEAAAVYDAFLALATAAADRGTAPDGLRAGLESLSNFEGAGVPVSFSPDDHEGIDPDDMAMLVYTKNQDSAGGEFFPEVDTGGGFFTLLFSSAELPPDYRFLTEGG